MPTTTDGSDESPWDQCGADDCQDHGIYSLQYRRLRDGEIIANGYGLFCPFHCAVEEREIRTDSERELERLSFFGEYFEEWNPDETSAAFNIRPERELELLLDYLDAQDAKRDRELASRRRGVEAALTILREKSDMYGLIREWDEPWKASRSSGSDSPGI